MSDKVRGGRGVDDRDVVAKTLRKGARETDRRGTPAEADRRGTPAEADRLGREQQRRATAYARARGQL